MRYLIGGSPIKLSGAGPRLIFVGLSPKLGTRSNMLWLEVASQS